MKTQMTSIISQKDESIIEDEKLGDVFTITPEMLSIVGGGEGMIVIG